MKNLTRALLITALLGSGMGLMPSAMADVHGMHDGSGGWKASLTDSQKNQISKLKLAYKKQVFPIKIKIKQARVELAMLIIADKPNQKDIDKKIDEIVKLKARKMRLKASHKIDVRKVLNSDQRAMFDLKMLKKAYHGKSGGQYGHH